MSREPEEDGKPCENVVEAPPAGFSAGEWALSIMLLAVVLLVLVRTYRGKTEWLDTALPIVVVACWAVAIALAIAGRRRKSGKAALVGLTVLGALGLTAAGLGLLAEPSAPAGRPARTAHTRAARQDAPAGQDTPEKTVAKLCSAMSDLDKRRYLECLTGSQERVTESRRGFQSFKAWERFRQAVVAAYGAQAWETLTADLGIPVITQEKLKRKFDHVSVHPKEIRGDRAEVDVGFLADGQIGTMFLVKAGGVWRVNADRPLPAEDDHVHQCAGRSLDTLPALQVKVGRPGVTIESLRKDLEAAFQGLARHVRPGSPGLSSQTQPSSRPYLVIDLVVPMAGSDDRYVVEGRRTGLPALREFLIDRLRQNRELKVLTRADPEVSDADFARLVELCRECGVQEPNIGYQVDAQRDSRPASRPQAPPRG